MIGYMHERNIFTACTRFSCGSGLKSKILLGQRYTIVAPSGEGAFSRSFLAKDEYHGSKLVNLKISHQSNADIALRVSVGSFRIAKPP